MRPSFSKETMYFEDIKVDLFWHDKSSDLAQGQEYAL